MAVYKLWYSRLVSLSVQFLIHASSSICICLVWRICMMPDAFLMCAASASERVLVEPFWKAPRSPERSSRWLGQKSWWRLNQRVGSWDRRSWGRIFMRQKVFLNEVSLIYVHLCGSMSLTYSRYVIPWHSLTLTLSVTILSREIKRSPGETVGISYGNQTHFKYLYAQGFQVFCCTGMLRECVG